MADKKKTSQNDSQQQDDTKECPNCGGKGYRVYTVREWDDYRDRYVEKEKLEYCSRCEKTGRVPK